MVRVNEVECIFGCLKMIAGEFAKFGGLLKIAVINIMHSHGKIPDTFVRTRISSIAVVNIGEVIYIIHQQYIVHFFVQQGGIMVGQVQVCRIVQRHLVSAKRSNARRVGEFQKLVGGFSPNLGFPRKTGQLQKIKRESIFASSASCNFM